VVHYLWDCFLQEEIEYFEDCDAYLLTSRVQGVEECSEYLTDLVIFLEELVVLLLDDKVGGPRDEGSGVVSAAFLAHLGVELGD